MSHAPFAPGSDARSPRRLRPAPRTLSASLGALALLAAAKAPAQTLFTATEHAEAGQAISVTGSGFDGSTRLSLQRYGSTGVLGASASVPISNQADYGLVAQLPANLAFGVFRLQATGAAGAGGLILLNAPRIQWADSTEAMPGGSVRLVGRNFRPAAPYTTARMVDTTTGASLPATLTAGSDYDATFTVPAGAIAGHAYKVYLNSNLAGAASEAMAPETVAIVPKADDPFGLNTSWAGDFKAIAANVINAKTDPRLSLHMVGDGSTNDARALAAAISYASSRGGGTVYIPAGNYNVDDGTPINLNPTVVMKGDGAGKTVLQVGYRFNAATACPNGYSTFTFYGGGHNGITGLTFRNQNGNATPNGIMRGAIGNDLTPRCFMTNVDFEINNGMSPGIYHIRQGVIQNCRFLSTAANSDPVLIGGSQYLRLSNNVFDYRVGRVQMPMGYRDVIEGNWIGFNNAYRVPGSFETGGMQLSFGQQVLVKGNSILGYGPTPTKGPVDGEMIGAQRSTVPDFCDVGQVASVSGTLLKPVNKNWPASWLAPNNDALDRSYVAIVRGKGLGQWRRVVSHDTSSLTVNQPWAVAPDANSTYSVATFTALQQTYIGNAFSGGDTGISFWQGAMDCVAANNVLKDTGGIMFRAQSQGAPTAQGTVSHDIVWNDVVRDNSITTTSARTPATITFLGHINRDLGNSAPVGSLVLGADVRNNTVVGSLYRSSGVWDQSDGYEVIGFRESDVATTDALTNWGTVVWNDTATGAYQKLRTAQATASALDPALAAVSSAQ